MADFTTSLKEGSDKNISDIERLISVLGGAYLLYDSLKSKKKSIPEIAAAGFMLYRGLSGFCPAGSAGKKLFSKPVKPHNGTINIHSRLIVKKPINEVYNFWRHLGNLPLFMEHVESVTVLSDTLSEWKIKLPGNLGIIGWKSGIVAEDPYRFIGWHSLQGSIVRHSGKVEFKDAGELGTLVHVVLSYHSPLGSVGEDVARLMTPVFEKMVRNDIMGFKRYMETGTTAKLQQEITKIYT